VENDIKISALLRGSTLFALRPTKKGKHTYLYKVHRLIAATAILKKKERRRAAVGAPQFSA
jgi:hypothetical protein